MASYSDIKRTISASLAGGNKKRAQELASDNWGSLTGAQRSELSKLGVSPIPSGGLASSKVKNQFDNATGNYGKTTVGNLTGVKRNTGGTSPSGSLGGGTLNPSGAILGAAAGAYTPSQKAKETLDNISKTLDTVEKTTQVEMPTSVGERPTYNSEYMDQLNALARQLTSMNYDDWTKGSQYQSLADRYGQNGRLSMQDVLGQVASRTGGLASSYATTAAQQQYNQYMAQLEEVARQMYSQERGDLMDNANLYRNLANDEYDRYRDSLADYNERLAAAQAGADYSGQFTAADGPTLAKTGNRVSAAGSGVASFSDIKRTISGRLASGNVESASQLVESVWDNLSTKQKQEIKKMGFNVSE